MLAWPAIGLIENVAHGLDVPTPELPNLSTMKDDMLEDPTTKPADPAGLEIESSAHGVEVPIPTLPSLSTMNVCALDEPIENATLPALFWTDSKPYGDVVPIPKAPPIVEDAVEVAIKLPMSTWPYNVVEAISALEVAENVPNVPMLAKSVPFWNVRLNPASPIVVLLLSAPPSEKTLVDDANDTPLVAVEVEYCEAVLRQLPLTAKQPVLPAAVMRLMPPPWKVEVAVVEANIPDVPAIASRVEGVVVPIPTLPMLLTINLMAVEDPITNEGTLPFAAVGLIENRPYGVVEPIPIKPELLIRIRSTAAVAPEGVV